MTEPPFIHEAVLISKRREVLGYAPPRCPDCNHEQVQLVGWMEVPAHWKCRMCKGRFPHEPGINTIVDKVMHRLAEKTVEHVRGSNDVPGFEACVNAELDRLKALNKA